MAKISKEFQYGQYTVLIETGEIAKQATGAVVVHMEGTVVLVTVVGSKEAKPSIDFLPLIIHYEERSYAGGKIPGGFYKREGRPSSREILIARLIDRPIRPLFPQGFTHEVQIVATVLSVNPEVEPDIPAMLGASAALAISGLPFSGPIGAARVGYQNGQFILNPTKKQLASSQLDLVVSGTKNAVLMVESEAKLLTEEIMLDAVWYGHREMQTAIQAIQELSETVSPSPFPWNPLKIDEQLSQSVKEFITPELISAYQISNKAQRENELSRLKEKTFEQFRSIESDYSNEVELKRIFELLERQIVRGRILEGYSRIDGRDTRTVRPLAIRVGVLPRTHGSALFTRGETQSLAVVTLGTERDAQVIDSVMGDEKEKFLLHYNFPPFCTGEVAPMTGPKRREIGHGRLARRGLQGVLPDHTQFPYVIRIVSEITEANGSSSMASVCGASLALMDAGVPIKFPVAGIAMGLVKEENKFAILTDILGDEDHLGDMDFKVAGTREGITALQMDIKIEGITAFIMQKALGQAREGRLYILDHMNRVIDQPREKLSEFAPTMRTVKIDPEKIREVIGKGGSTIRSIIEETGASIDISDDGVVQIAGVGEETVQNAYNRIQQITGDIEIGNVYTGTVTKITDFGAFVSVTPTKDGLVHISQIADRHLDKVTDALKEGQTVKVKVIDIDRQGRVRLSMKPSVLKEENEP